MSGAFGWARNDDNQSAPTRHTAMGGFSDAKNIYQRPATPQPSRVSFAQATHQTGIQSIPTATHTLKSSARNVLIVITDVTGSMGDNPKEIFRRLPLMYEEACTYLGSDDTEILFIVFGDARTDEHAVQIARFGRGAELDGILTSFSLNCGGGGQGSETPELVAYYLLKQVDTRTAQHAYVWFITDEAGCAHVDPRLTKRWLDLELDAEYSQAQAVFRALERRMHVLTLLFETNAYKGRPEHAQIRPYWEHMLSRDESIVPISDARRIVDVMLGTIAAKTGQLDLFTSHLKSRQLPTRHGAANVQSVLASIALIGEDKGSLTTPHGPGTHSLLPDK